MKWIVVLFVLLNLAAYLMGQRVDPGAHQADDSGRYETINAAAMSVIRPSRQTPPTAAPKMKQEQVVEESGLAQLKVDQAGKVMIAKQSENSHSPAPAAADSSPPAQPADSNPAKVSPVPDRATDNGEDVAQVASARPAVQESPIPEDKGDLACYRLGPYTDQAGLAASRKQLDRLGINYTLEKGAASEQKIAAVRVYLGSYADDRTLEASKKKLEEMKVENFVIRQNGSAMLQLGYFKEPARALNYQKELQFRGLDAKTKNILAKGGQAVNQWLGLQATERKNVQALELPSGVKREERACTGR